MSRHALIGLTMALWFLLGACGGRSVSGAADGGGADATRADGASLPDGALGCYSDEECPEGMICAGCYSPPDCPMCAVCYGNCVPGPATCFLTTDCSAGKICDFGDDDACGTRGSGRCRAVGPCADVMTPVCGCDGHTYMTECDAAAARTSVAHQGPCEDAVTCSELGQKYREAVGRARQCCAECAALQCYSKVEDDLACGCPTFVNTTGELDALRAEWRALDCDLLGWDCPAMPCSAASGGACVTDAQGQGRCADLTF